MSCRWIRGCYQVCLCAGGFATEHITAIYSSLSISKKTHRHATVTYIDDRIDLDTTNRDAAIAHVCRKHSHPNSKDWNAPLY